MLCTDERQCSLFALLDAPPPAAPIPSREQQLDEGYQLDGLTGGAPPAAPADPPALNDFASIKGQEIAKRMLEIALVAGHSVMLAGPSGCGKSMLIAAAREIGGLLTADEWTGTGIPPACDHELLLHLQSLDQRDWDNPPECETSATIKARVRAAMSFRDKIGSYDLDEPAKKLLEAAAGPMKLDQSAQWKVTQVAKSIAALAECGQIWRIHIAEALSYRSRPNDTEPEPTPEPEPRPTIAQERDRVRKAMRGDFEIVEVDPKRLEFQHGDISNSYSAQALAEKGAVKSPFKFRGCEWVNAGGLWGEPHCYRIVPVEAFDGPHAPYRDHDWDSKRGDRQLGGYHGMSAKHGSREVVLQGPPIVCIAGQAEQAALL